MPADNDEKTRLLGLMMRRCALRECCRSDIRRKLAALPPADADDIVDTLCREGYLDDARYARAFARDKSALQGWGSRRIQLALQQKQIDAADIAAALSSIDAPAAETRMEQVLSAKWKSLAREEDPARKQAKFFRYGLGRGYGYDEIKRMYDYLRRD